MSAAERPCVRCESMTGDDPPGLPSEARGLCADCLDDWYQERQGRRAHSRRRPMAMGHRPQ